MAREHSVSSRMTSWIAVAEEPSVHPRDRFASSAFRRFCRTGMSVEGSGLTEPTSSLWKFGAALRHKTYCSCHWMM